MNAIRTAAGAVAIATVLNGCHSHVTLAVPPPTAPQSVRLASYQKLRSLSYHTTETTIYQSGVIPISDTKTTDYMQLANGMRVYYPEDIKPVVDAESPSARAADASVSKRSVAGYLGIAALASLVGGMALALSSAGSTNDVGEPNRTPMFIGIGIAAVGTLGFGFAAQAVATSSQEEAATSFETYNADLSQHLRLTRPPESEHPAPAPAPQPEADARERTCGGMPPCSAALLGKEVSSLHMQISR